MKDGMRALILRTRFDLLSAADQLGCRHRAWTQCANARDADGNACSASSTKAVAWSIVGALEYILEYGIHSSQATPDDKRHRLTNALVVAFPENSHGMPVTTSHQALAAANIWNNVDCRGQEHAIQHLRKAAGPRHEAMCPTLLALAEQGLENMSPAPEPAYRPPMPAEWPTPAKRVKTPREIFEGR